MYNSYTYNNSHDSMKNEVQKEISQILHIR